MASLRPAIQLKIELLPTFGLPTIATRGMAIMFWSSIAWICVERTGKPAMVVAFRDSGESFSLQGGSLVAGFFGKTWFYE
jgi:hypothetical protein